MLSYLNNWNADLGMYRAIFGMRITATTTGTCSACPSTEALNVAEWIYHNTAFDTAKSLIATHAFSITSSNDPKYFQSKSLLGGLASNMEFNELTHYTQSQARFQKIRKKIITFLNSETNF